MKTHVQKYPVKCFLLAGILSIAILSANNLQAQNCPPSIATTITSFPNTYYPGQQATVNAGSTSVQISAATYGTTPIGVGDALLIIQMQGAQIVSTNDITYGDGANGSGYLNNAQLYAGNMEYVVANNSVPLTGGTLMLQTGTVNHYRNAAFGTDGQYNYQVIRVPVYYNLILDAPITPPSWDGTTGGVIVMAVMNTLNMNGHSINVTGTGFRGGGSTMLGFPGTGATRDFVTVSPTDADIISWIGNHASKGEGIAGTPRLINSNNYGSLQKNIEEGYPGGSFGRGAPGNAGGGASDDNDSTPSTSNNCGGGGGGNGGAGGNGGNTFGTNRPYGGYPGAPFTQRSPLRLVMGGGGGAGDTNNGTGTPFGGLASSGAAGGGIVIINAGAIINPGFVLARGSNAITNIGNDGAGGGGAGGSVLINARSGHSNITVSANGGNGGSSVDRSRHGPGGGGGGGVIYSDGALNAASTVSGGTAGTTNPFAVNYGALSGAAGELVTGPVMVFPPGCMVLPMKFLSVNGKRNGTQVLINWEVSDDKNVTNYIIERSDNGANFFTAGIVSKKPANGDIGKYTFSEASPDNEGNVFYRIKAQDADGQKMFSKVITVKTDLGEGALDLSPVPADGYSLIRWVSGAKSNLTVTLFNVAGHAVLRRLYRLKTGANELQLTNLETLPAGVYVVQAFDGVRYQNGKLVIHHNIFK